MNIKDGSPHTERTKSAMVAGLSTQVILHVYRLGMLLARHLAGILRGLPGTYQTDAVVGRDCFVLHVVWHNAKLTSAVAALL